MMVEASLKTIQSTKKNLGRPINSVLALWVIVIFKKLGFSK